MKTRPTPPRAQARPTALETHGISRQDEYAWLRADNWQEVMRDPSVLADDIRAYLEAENAYQQAVMAPTQDLQDTLFAEMRGRIKEDDSSVPSPDGPYAYGVKYETGGQQPIFFRTPREGGAETVLLHGDKEAEGKAYFKIGAVSQSPDHKLLAWAVDDKGSEYFSFQLRDLGTGKDMGYRIEDTGGGGVFSKDSKYMFYIRLDANHRPSKLFRHEIGTDPTGDVLVYEEKDPGFFMGVGKTQSGDTILIDIHDHETSEVWMIPADQPLSPPVLIAPRDTSVEYSVEDHGDTLYILTNLGDAEDFKIVTAPKATPGREFWKDLIPHKPGCLILSLTVYKTFMTRLERENGLPRIVIRRLADNVEHEVAFDEEAYSLGMGDGYEFDTQTIRFSYSSMTTPSQTFDYNVETRERVLRKEQEVPSGHTADDYVTRRLQAPAADGETVPISLFYHKDTPLDGSAPCLLYGYGSYGISIPASFNTNALSLANRGFVYAIAHIRGGKDKGFRWYKAGRREHKKNTFTDFIAAADHLVAEHFTAYDKIIAQGGSAGGMLMGAISNIAPEKFAGIIAEVPFVDVLNTMLDDTLPLTPPEWPEWGNPITDKAAYEYIASYSPYDNVEAKAYPAILAVGGLTDPRVTYWEPAKWVAKLRETKTGDSLLMLKTNMDAGHGGASGRFDRLKEVALNQAFALMVAGKA
ncbi:oligopeptidase B [Roseibium hamelinense]|uniref:Oligopeptidase B n=1 Tax=Roseibium hamelinense TaxID=150831 RepID=A0A562TI79_9HYPH|nr:S9 family peptidase [Roseibium hamelinense]MTI42676.1 S9 family peptidase [Roseibium hamelinense]TWI93302.1 oligopeptidase B [Roseibium hamelinense]